MSFFVILGGNIEGRIQELEYRIQEKSNVTKKIAVAKNRRHCDVVLSKNHHKKKGPTVAAEPFVKSLASHEVTKTPGKSVLNADVTQIKTFKFKKQYLWF